jgi:hypothetical protein
VVQGFRQKPGRDYDETYANVPTLTTFHFCLALNHYLKLVPCQLDIAGAYLEAPLKKTLYICPPLGYSNVLDHVWLLKKALYELC